MEMEYKALPLEIRAEGDGGVIQGYGSVFGNRDSYGDVIEKGAFAASIARRSPKMLWQHRMDKPIGVWDEVEEDDKGLRMKGRVADTAQGREAMALVKMGAMDGLSIGFRTIKDEVNGEDRLLKEIDLWEVSFVTIPANGLSTITSAKSIDTERGLEAFLRESGFSRWGAKAITAGGYKAFAQHRDDVTGDLDADQRDAEAAKHLTSILNAMKGIRNV